MVSIIVPVYNTQKYLDKCIQAILHQTYTNLEIIFINDGSTDHSLQILENYQAQDDRIQIISVENGGQGRARNIGIEQAMGEYIMFVDSDDWISENCVELLYHTLINVHCDIAMGSIAKTCYEEEAISFIYAPKIPTIITRDNKKAFLFKILAFPFAQLLRKNLFTEHGITFPSHCFEDTVTLPLVYAVADKICYQAKVVYYYRNRAGSTVNEVEHIYDRIRCIPTLENGLKRLGLYKEYEEEFLQFAFQRSRINRRKVRELLDRQYQEFERKQFIFDYQLLGKIDDKKNSKAYVYGSYNLMIVAKIFLQLKNEEHVPNYFGFQNVISSVSPKGHVTNKIRNTLADSTVNQFRKVALIQDFEKTLLNQEPEQIGSIDYFILDFLEERYDTGRADTEYFTISDAFVGVEPALHMEYDVIKSFGTEWNLLWHEKCDSFVRFLRHFMREGKVILVKMKLSEKYLENGREHFFDDIEQIRTVNEHLEKCYDYFIRQYPDVFVIDVENLEAYYAAKEFRHGCFPWHLNDDAYKEIARKMNKTVDYPKYMELVSKKAVFVNDF